MLSNWFGFAKSGFRIGKKCRYWKVVVVLPVLPLIGFVVRNCWLDVSAADTVQAHFSVIVEGELPKKNSKFCISFARSGFDGSEMKCEAIPYGAYSFGMNIDLVPGLYSVAYFVTNGNAVDYSYETSPVGDYFITLDENGFPANSNYFDYLMNVEVHADGGVTYSNEWGAGYNFVAPIISRDTTQNPVKLDVAVKRHQQTAEENETLVVNLEHSSGNPSYQHTTLATKSIPINEDGLYRVEFDDFAMPQNTRTLCLSYEVLKSNGEKDPYWSSFSCDQRPFLYDNDDYAWFTRGGNNNANNRLAVVGSDTCPGATGSWLGYMANVYYDDDWNEYDYYNDFVYQHGGTNYFVPYVLTLEYNKVDDIGVENVTASEEGKEVVHEFHLAQGVKDVKDGGHYMVVAKSFVDDKYYALSVNNNSHAVQLTDFNDDSLADNYMVSTDTLLNSDYVFTARSTEVGGDPTMVTTKFVSNVLSDNNRYKTLKIENDNYDSDDMFNDVGGAMISIFDEGGRFMVAKSNGNHVLALNDIFGNAFFNSLKLSSTYSPELVVYDERDKIFLKKNNNGDDRMFNKCVTVSLVALAGNHEPYCTLETDLLDYYSSDMYRSAWISTAMNQFVFLLTDTTDDDPSHEEQLPEGTYFPVEDPEAYRPYRYGYDESFVLDYVDDSNGHHILSATEWVDGESHPYYLGSDARIGENGNITTLVKDSFVFSPSDVKEETDGRLKLHGLRQNDVRSSAPYLMIDNADGEDFISYSSSRKEMSFYYEGDTVYVRGSKTDRWIGWGEFTDKDGNQREGFVSVKSKDEAVGFKLYYRNGFTTEGSTLRSTMNFYDKDGMLEIIYAEGTYNGHWGKDLHCYYYYVDDVVQCRSGAVGDDYIIGSHSVTNNGLSYRVKMPMALGTVMDDGTVFAGYTIDPTKAGAVIELDEDTENIYNYKDGLSDYVASDYKIINNKDYVDPYSFLTFFDTPQTQEIDGYDITISAHADLYPVFIRHAYSQPALVKDPNEQAILGAVDWKEEQIGGSSGDVVSGEKDTQVWQGSINVETYLDGELYGQPSKLYFQYHNDDAADVILKFVNNEQLNLYSGNDQNKQLEEFLLDDDNYPTVSQSGEYHIDAIIAEQAGSENGLTYALNWADDHGARLDNVKGGSTIKVYFSTGFPLDCYMNDLFLGGRASQNDRMSDATAKAIENEGAEYSIKRGETTDEGLLGLLDKDTTMVNESIVYKPANPKRFFFETYAYILNDKGEESTDGICMETLSERRFNRSLFQILRIEGGEVVDIVDVDPSIFDDLSEDSGFADYYVRISNYAKERSIPIGLLRMKFYDGEVDPVDPVDPDDSVDDERSDEEGSDVVVPDTGGNTNNHSGSVGFSAVSAIMVGLAVSGVSFWWLRKKIH